MENVLQVLQVDRIIDILKIEKLRHTRLFMPSWYEMYLVDGRACGDEEEEKGLPDGSNFEDDSQEKFNIAPVVFGAIALITCIPQILGQGVESFWAAAKERVGIHSLRHYRTLYMAGELEHLESISGILNTVCQDRMFLVWGILATFTHGITKNLTCEGCDDEDREDFTAGEGTVRIYDREDSAAEMIARHATEPAPGSSFHSTMESGPGFALTYALTLHPGDYRRFLSVVSDGLCTHVIKELPSYAEGSVGTTDPDAKMKITNVQTGRIKDSIPVTHHTVGIILRSSDDDDSTDVATTSYETMEVRHSSRVFYVFAKQVNQIPFCDEFYHMEDVDLPDASELLVEFINITSNQEKENPLESLYVISLYFYWSIFAQGRAFRECEMF